VGPRTEARRAGTPIHLRIPPPVEGCTVERKNVTGCPKLNRSELDTLASFFTIIDAWENGVPASDSSKRQLKMHSSVLNVIVRD
jgi:hypothetical protein